MSDASVTWTIGYVSTGTTKTQFLASAEHVSAPHIMRAALL